MNGYIFIADQKYFGLLEIAIKSVLEFSDKKIRVFGINFDYPSTSRIMASRVNMSNVNFQNICYFKLSAMMESEFETSVFLDADMIATKKVDMIFEYEKKMSSIPLFPLHPDSDIATVNIINSASANFFGVKRATQPYVHGDPCLFKKGSINFLKECLDMIGRAKSKGINVYSNDEGIINLNLWRHNITNYHMNVCAPNYTYMETKLGMRSIEMAPKDYYSENNLYYLCHGCKDINRANKIFEGLKKRDGIV